MKKSLLSVLLMLSAYVLYAQVPTTISYQGIAVDGTGNPVPDGNVTVRFVFYNASSGGSIRYQTAAYSVTSYKGMFTAIIGNSVPNATDNPPIPTNIWGENLFVEVSVNGSTQAPRIALSTTPYAFKAETANAIDAAGVTGTANLPNTVLDADLQDLADGTLSGSKVGSGIAVANLSGSVAVANGGTGASTAAAARTNLGVQAADADLDDLADGTLTGSKVDGTTLTTVSATNITTGTLPLANGGTGATTAANARTNLGAQASDTDLDDLADGSLTGTKVGTGIDAANITTNSLALVNGGTGANTAAAARANLGAQASDADLDDLADGSLTGSKIGTGIAGANLTDGTVSTTKIADDAVTVAKIGTAGGTDANKVLTTDGSGNPQWVTGSASTVGLIAGGGLTLTGSTFSLGGALTANTTLPSATFNFNYGGTGKFGIASATPGSKFEVGGNVAIGNGFNSIDGPTNGLIVQGTTGIGVSAPTHKLHIAGDGTTEASDDIKLEGNGTTTPAFAFTKTTGTQLAPAVTGAGDIGQLVFNGHTGSSFITGALIKGVAETSFTTNNINGALTFTTAATSGALTERMRITSTGNVGIGTNAPSSTFAVGTNKFNVAGADGDLTFSDVSGSINFPASGSATPMIHMFASAGTTSRMVLAHSPAFTNYGLQYDDNTDKFHFIGAGNPTLTADINNLRVGIGVTTPVNKLDVEGGAVIGATYSGSSTAPTNGLLVEGNVGLGTASATYPVTLYNSTDARVVNIEQDYAGSSTQYGMTIDMTSATGTSSKYGIDCNVAGTAGSTGTVYGLETDISPNGTGSHYGLNSVIGNTTTGTGTRYAVYGLAYSGTASANNGTLYGVYGYGYSTSANHSGPVYGVYGITSDGGGTGAHYAVYANGDMAYTGTITDVSDQRLKKDIKPMENMLPKLMRLKPSTFLYKADEYKFMNLPTEPQLGLIAQEVETVFPEAVTENQHPGELDANGNAFGKPFDYKGVDYTTFIPVLIKGLQEQQAEIDELKAEVAELKKLVMAQLKSNPSGTTTTSGTATASSNDKK